MVARTFEIDAHDRLVAAHAWEVSGVAGRRLRGRVRQPARYVLHPLGDQPDISGGDLLEVAERIIRAAGRPA